MYKVSLKKNQESEVEIKGDEILINGSVLDWDLNTISKDKFRILTKQSSFNAEITHFAKQDKTVEIKINNQIYTVKVKDKMDQLLEKMGIANLAASVFSEVKAPMPGLILDVSVKEGDTVKKGDQLMVLEAMKMENVLKSPGEGTVKSVEVEKGNSVEKNQILIKFN